MTELEDITLQTIQNLLWAELVAEGEFELLERLRLVEKYDMGTVIIPSGPKGFSESDRIHNLVMDWLELKGINAWNPESEIKALERALREEKL